MENKQDTETINQLNKKEKYELINETTNLDILEILLFDEDWMIANSCFYNNYANELSSLVIEKVYEKYQNHGDGAITCRIAEHKNTPTEILFQILKKTKSSTMRAIIASNKNCSYSMIKEFSTDEDNTVRYWVSRNENISFDVLQEMIEKEKKDFIIKSILSHKNYKEVIQ